MKVPNFKGTQQKVQRGKRSASQGLPFVTLDLGHRSVLFLQCSPKKQNLTVRSQGRQNHNRKLRGIAYEGNLVCEKVMGESGKQMNQRVKTGFSKWLQYMSIWTLAEKIVTIPKRVCTTGELSVKAHGQKSVKTPSQRMQLIPRDARQSIRNLF